MSISPKLVDAELNRRASLASLNLLDNAFPQQLKFIQSPNKLKALFCTRRAAKSYTAGLYLVKEALENPGVSCLFIALTRKSAKGIAWKDVLKVINKQYKLGIKFNETELTATLPNGSVIYVTGVDAKDDEMEKLLGQKYKLVCIDEAASYSIDLRALVYGYLKPAMTDYQGTICLMGTSGNLTKGLFFDVTNSTEPGWEVHSWTAHDNPFVAKQWQAELDDIAANRPLFMQTPLFKQWYLNQWVIDKDALVYKFNSEKNRFKTLPTPSRGDWIYRIACDLGYEDASAFVVGAYHEFDKKLYIVHTYKKSHMDLTDVAEYLKGLIVKFNAVPEVVIDNANKQAVEEMKKRHQLNLVAADKRGKEDFIEMLNADLIMEHIKLGPNTDPLVDELQNLVWVEKNGEIVRPKEENPACDNHLCDAFLYLWRKCTNFTGERLKPAPKYGSKEYHEAEVAAIEQHFERMAEGFDNPETSDEDYI